MTRSKITVIARGRQYILGFTDEYGGIWRNGGWRWRLVARYPASEEAKAIAWEHFQLWESGGEPIVPDEFAPGENPEIAWRFSPRNTAAIGVVLVLAGIGAGVYFALTSSSGQGHATSQLAGSGSSVQSAPSTTGIPPVGTGYLSVSSDEVMFMQWNQNGDSLSGTIQDDYAQGDPPDGAVSTNTVEFTGQIHGSSISISFQGSPMEFGTISDNGFTINVPNAQGELVPVAFTAGSAASFNSAVTKLHTAVDRANQLAADQQALQKAEQQIAADASEVQGDIGCDQCSSGLSADEGSLTSDVGNITIGIAHAAKDLTTTQNAESKVASEPGSENACYDASTVSYDASTVSYDSSTVSYEVGIVQSEISAIREEIAQVQADFAQFQTDSSAVPGFTPDNPPSQAEVNQATNTANQVVAGAIGTTNGDIDQTNADVTAAYTSADKAYQDANCGTGPSPPTPLQHIQ